eukprot:3639886-Rhodomonas_salina.1
MKEVAGAEGPLGGPEGTILAVGRTIASSWTSPRMKRVGARRRRRRKRRTKEKRGTVTWKTAWKRLGKRRTRSGTGGPELHRLAGRRGLGARRARWFTAGSPLA